MKISPVWTLTVPLALALTLGSSSCSKKDDPAQSKAAPAAAAQTAPGAAVPALNSAAKQPEEAAKTPEGAAPTEGTVLKVRKLKGGRTVFSSGGVRRVKGPTSYEVQVGLADGTRYSFLPLQNKLVQGSKVSLRFAPEDRERKNPMLPAGIPPEGRRIKAEVLPSLRPTPAGEGEFTITFPGVPEETKTDLGTLYRYEYKFSKSYRPDTYYFIRLGAEGNGKRKFFKEQAQSLLALTGGKRIAARVKGPRRDKKTGLKRASGRFSVEIKMFPQVGRIQLWHDKKQNLIYGAWVHAYSSNRLASDRSMKRDFFGSFKRK